MPPQLRTVPRGRIIPLTPYCRGFPRALPVTIALTLAALLIFGGVKGQLTGVAPLRSASRTAAAAFAIARLAGR